MVTGFYIFKNVTNYITDVNHDWNQDLQYVELLLQMSFVKTRLVNF